MSRNEPIRTEGDLEALEQQAHNVKLGLGGPGGHDDVIGALAEALRTAWRCVDATDRRAVTQVARLEQRVAELTERLRIETEGDI